MSEYESTITLNITKNIYDSNVSYHSVDLIFVFSDSRLSARKFERKTKIFEDMILGFYKGCFFPIQRTIAREELLPLDQLDMLPTKITHRKITKILALGHVFRLSYNQIMSPKGIKYTAECEVEYLQNTNMNLIWSLEEKMMELMNLHCKFEFLEDAYFKLEQIFSAAVPKLQPWHNFEVSKPYLWALKWNGVKAKLVYSSVVGCYLWRDADDILKINNVPNEFRVFDKLCLQVEVLEDLMVVTEILAINYNNVLFINEPNTNIACLEHYSYLNNMDVRLDGKLVRVQQFYAAPKPDTYKHCELYDGLVIMQDNKLIKWKQPTIDVKYLGDGFAVGNHIIYIPNDGNLEINAIYEITIGDIILRKRNDRLACSTQNEYEIYLESVDMFKKYNHRSDVN